MKFNVDSIGKVGDRMRMKPSKDIDLDEAMFKWYKQERAAGVQVTGITLCNAAETSQHPSQAPQRSWEASLTQNKYCSGSHYMVTAHT